MRYLHSLNRKKEALYVGEKRQAQRKMRECMGTLRGKDEDNKKLRNMKRNKKNM
jgi:hypothetical protein